MYVSRSIHSGQSDAFSCRKRRMKTDRRLLSGTAVMLVLSMLLTLSSCSKSGGTDDSFAVWKWILKPTVVCDDIQPVILFGYKYENGIPQYNKNNSQAYDKVSLILNRSDNDPLYSNIDEQYYGLIAYNGLEIFPCRSDFIYATQNSDEKLIYITDREYNEYIDEHYMINSFTDYDEPMETDSILYWIIIGIRIPHTFSVSASSSAGRMRAARRESANLITRPLQPILARISVRKVLLKPMVSSSPE